MEIVYALHVTTSSCNRMGSSGNNKALFSLLQEISVDSYRHSTWIFNCVVFFLFQLVSVVPYTAFLGHTEIAGDADVFCIEPFP